MRPAVDLHTHRKLRGRTAQGIALLLRLSLQDKLKCSETSAESSGGRYILSCAGSGVFGELQALLNARAVGRLDSAGCHEKIRILRPRWQPLSAVLQVLPSHHLKASMQVIILSIRCTYVHDNHFSTSGAGNDAHHSARKAQHHVCIHSSSCVDSPCCPSHVCKAQHHVGNHLPTLTITAMM